MNTTKQVLAALKKVGNPLRIQTFANHGAPADKMFGVSVADMKVLARQIKGQQELAYELYEAGNGDAQYLAGMVADGSQMTKARLDKWARQAMWQMVSEYTVPWVATESDHAPSLARKWRKAKKESVASSGWNTWSGHVAVTPDDELHLDEIESGIDAAQNRVRYTMNGFVIAVGAYVMPLARRAKATARRLGRVDVEMGGTSCKVPLATEAIAKVEQAGRAGKKRKTIKC